MSDSPRPRVGFVVNPIAGIGGAVALKGSDGDELVDRARRLGGTSPAAVRARAVLEALRDVDTLFDLLTGPADMGAAHVPRGLVRHEIVGGPPGEPSTAADTVRVARELVARSVDLLLFVGGDGTARDVLDAVGARVPVLGIPAGVKMHSAVFATSPRRASEAIAAFVRGETAAVAREVMDVDEAQLRQGRLSARLYGVMHVPGHPRLLQGAKAGSRGGADVAGIAAQIASEMRDDRRYVLGPGTTVRAVADQIGVATSLLGVDVVQGNEVLSRDVTEHALFALVHGHPSEIIVAVTGGQGFVLGRGNQQISPRVVRAVGLAGLRIVATMDKLLALGSPLRVDTGDGELDRALAGYRRVTTGYRRETMWMVEP